MANNAMGDREKDMNLQKQIAVLPVCWIYCL